MQDVKYYYYMYDSEGVIQSSITGKKDEPPKPPEGFYILPSDRVLCTNNLAVDTVSKKFITVQEELSDEEKNMQAMTSRRMAYKNESDPLYMEWQYDKTEESESLWRDKVKEIKLRYPII